MSSLFKNLNHVLPVQDPVVIMKEIMSLLFKVPINSGLAKFDHHTQLNSGLKNDLNSKKIKLAQMNFFLKHNCIIKISCTSWPIHSAKFLKKFLELVQSYEDVLFSGPKWPICHEQFFLVQNIIVTFICAYWPFSLCKI